MEKGTRLEIKLNIKVLLFLCKACLFFISRDRIRFLFVQWVLTSANMCIFLVRKILKNVSTSILKRCMKFESVIFKAFTNLRLNSVYICIASKKFQIISSSLEIHENICKQIIQTRFCYARVEVDNVEI